MSEEPLKAEGDGEDQVDAKVFDQNNDLIQESHEAEFLCYNPSTKSGHTVYTCKGADEQGLWEGERRYNEFFKLHEKLLQGWPGIPVPSLPPKKAIGNKHQQFINERRFYLERFLKKVSAFNFVLNSQEFNIFSRPQGDIDKQLTSMRKPTTPELVEKYRFVLKIEEQMYTPLIKDKLDNQCKEFLHFSKQIVPLLKALVKAIALFSQNKSQCIQDNKNFMAMLDKYEELNLANYVEGNEEKMVFGNKQSEDTENVKEQVAQMCDNLKNPYFNLYHWCKGELLDIEAVTNSLTQRDKIQEKIGKTQKKKISTQGDLENITTGRKTVKTLFKNQNDTGTMVNKIELTDKEIESLQQLHDLLTIYLGETIIPPFKERRLNIYSKIVQQFNVMQINNAHQIASFWSHILQNPNIQNANEEVKTAA
mmetsp:Transcript_15382/g.26001  ORF Transcript_15382/g.26001 Transcript_15382/m.26001 type:complete len:422 (+) Transcript_15382:65-1330(+)